MANYYFYFHFITTPPADLSSAPSITTRHHIQVVVAVIVMVVVVVIVVVGARPCFFGNKGYKTLTFHLQAQTLNSRFSTPNPQTLNFAIAGKSNSGNHDGS